MSRVSTTIHVKCPHCGKEQYSYSQNYDFTTLYGSPIRKCRHCNETYIDTNYHEPAFTKNYIKDDGNSLGYLFGMVVGAVALIGYIIYFVKKGVAIKFDENFVILFTAACLVLACIIGYIKEKMDPDKTKLSLRISNLEASLIRLKDPDYIDFLRSHNCFIPNNYSELVRANENEFLKVSRTNSRNSENKYQ